MSGEGPARRCRTRGERGTLAPARRRLPAGCGVSAQRARFAGGLSVERGLLLVGQARDHHLLLVARAPQDGSARACPQPRIPLAWPPVLHRRACSDVCAHTYSRHRIGRVPAIALSPPPRAQRLAGTWRPLLPTPGCARIAVLCPVTRQERGQDGQGRLYGHARVWGSHP